MSTHGYTGAHFAATLLECGPHIWHDCKICGPEEECAINRQYKTAVYSHFFELFPEMVENTHSDTAHGPAHEWTAYWREYLAWVET